MKDKVQQAKEDLFEKIKRRHPIGAIRWYHGRKAEVIGYYTDGSQMNVMVNAEDTYRGGFKTEYVYSNELTDKP